MKFMVAEINKLKEELQQNRLKSSLKLSFEEKQLSAQEESLLRVFQQKEAELEEDLLQQQKTNILEESSCSHFTKFSRDYIQKVRGKKNSQEDNAGR